MLPPDTPLISSTSSSSVVSRPSTTMRVAFNSSSTPRPKAAARAPPPDNATAAITVGCLPGPADGIEPMPPSMFVGADAASGVFNQGRVVEQAASRVAASSTAARPAP